MADSTIGLPEKDVLMVQDLSTLDVASLTPLTPEVISRQVIVLFEFNLTRT